jgi:hypothetical protein
VAKGEVDALRLLIDGTKDTQVGVGVAAISLSLFQPFITICVLGA